MDHNWYSGHYFLNQRLKHYLFHTIERRDNSLNWKLIGIEKASTQENQFKATNVFLSNV